MRVIVLVFLLALLALLSNAGAVEHPALLSPRDRVDRLAAGGAAWNTLKARCDAELDQLLAPGYAGWDWRDAAERFALAWLVMQRSDAVQAGRYGRKALALLKVLARHHNYGTPENAELVGVGDGATRTFTLPRLAVGPVTVLTTPITTRALTYGGATASLPDWGRILAIADSPTGASAYPPTDWRFSYRDGSDVLLLRWLTTHHPASGATYYVRITTAGNDGAAAAGAATISGTTLTLATAPAAGRAVFVRYLGPDYEQTGNFLGGTNSVQPDGPGYPMRAFAVGLANGYDLIHDLPEFTVTLKQEFCAVLNAQLDWYRGYGYERDGDIGNYFIRGYLMSTIATGWGTADENPRGQEWKDLGRSLLQRTYDGIARKIPGGYGPQGSYAVGTTNDCLQLFTLWKDISGEDLLPTLAWTDHLIPANIHGTRPDRTAFYDGGDWQTMPPEVPAQIGSDFLTYLPTHSMAPYARQWLTDLGQVPPAGPLSDYKVDFPLSYRARTTGPLYARSDWSTGAAWLAFAAGPMVVDHQHRDQGHLELVRGADALLVDAGGYDQSLTSWHNSLLVDDRGAGDLVVYPPDQGYWGDSVAITRDQEAGGTVYAQADLTGAWARPDGANAVRRALRSLVFIHPDLVVVHDAVHLANPATIVMANWNFAATPIANAGVYSATVGASRLFMRQLQPGQDQPVIAPVTFDGRTSFNYRQTSASGADRAFLHVFELAASGQAAMRPCALVTSTGNSARGATFQAGGSNRVVLFSATGTEITDRPFAYAYATGGAQRHLLSDLHPDSRHQVTVTSGGVTAYSAEVVSSAAGCLDLSFTAGAGQVAVTRSREPTVSVTAPTSGAVFQGPTAIDLAATASDPDGSVVRVEFFADGVKVGEAVTAPYAFRWLGVGKGSYVITARATDDSGVATTSAPVALRVDGPLPPHVRLVRPLSGASFSVPAAFTVEAEAGDADGTVARVVFSLDGAVIGTALAAPWQAAVTGLAGGSHLLIATATDDAGLTQASEPITVVVDPGGAPPTATPTAGTGGGGGCGMGAVSALAFGLFLTFCVRRIR